MTIHSNLSWCAYVCGRLLHPDDCDVFTDLPKYVSDVSSLSLVLECVLSAQLCPGNPDPDFVHLIELDGGEFKGENKEVVATLDATNEVRMNGRTYGQTIRTQDCEILCSPSSGERTVRCHRCSRFRGRSRHSHSDRSSVIADDSHTNYGHLNKEELVDRLRNVQKSRKSVRAKYGHLMKKLIRKGVKITEEDEKYVQAVIDEIAPDVEQKYGRDSPHYVL